MLSGNLIEFVSQRAFPTRWLCELSIASPSFFTSWWTRQLPGSIEVLRFEAWGAIEPPIRVLQTLALPLGDRVSILPGNNP